MKKANGDTTAPDAGAAVAPPQEGADDLLPDISGFTVEWVEDLWKKHFKRQHGVLASLEPPSPEALTLLVGNLLYVRSLVYAAGGSHQESQEHWRKFYNEVSAIEYIVPLIIKKPPEKFE
jgi:hypothetical protein